MQKSSKNRHLGTIAQNCRSVSSQLRHVSTIGINLLNSSISSTRMHNMANFDPLAAEIDLRVWGTPANFNGFRVLPSLLQRRRSPESIQTLHDVSRLLSSAGTLLCTFSDFRGLLPYDGILPGAKFTLRPCLAFSYIGSVTARHSSSGVSQTLRH